MHPARCSAILDQPHTADVRTLEQSEFYVADAPAILAGDPTVALYVAAILARRLDAANRWLVAVKRQVRAGEPPSVIGKAAKSRLRRAFPAPRPQTYRCLRAISMLAATWCSIEDDVEADRQIALPRCHYQLFQVVLSEGPAAL